MSVEGWFDDNQISNSEIGYISVKGVRTLDKNVQVYSLLNNYVQCTSPVK